ncbi:MAG: hypothetical protein GXO84_09395 [Chlorobi bacterium]|nr:hypothetical protein [Chlorobiota bacterium]
MKKITILVLLIITSLGYYSCEDEDNLKFIAKSPEALAFTNSFLDEYVLTPVTAGNLGERFTWNDADFDVPTVVNYDLEKSILGDFTDAEVVGTTTENELAVTIGNLLSSTDAGLDNDPNSQEPNIGDVYFRIRAYVGNSGPDAFSPVQTLTLVLPEDLGTGGGPNCPSIWVVGAGAVDAGWGWGTPIEFLCTDDVYKANITLVNDTFRFFLTEGDWGSGQNYPFYANDGYTIDSNLEDAMDGDNNFRFIGTPGEYSLIVDTINKTIMLGAPEIGPGNCDPIWVVGAGAVDAGWGWGTPIEFSCTDSVYRANINLVNDAFRFFLTEGDWGSGQNYPFYANDGYTIDVNLEDAMDGDNNFRFIGTPGYYLLTVDTVNKTITLGSPGQELPNCSSVWVVGAGAVDAGWGWDTPIEFTCTDNAYSAYINLTNDAFRFFLTEGDWGSGQNYPFYLNDGYTIDANLEDAMDGDNNFLFTGTPGNYYLRVDTVNKTIIIQ